MPPSQAYYLKIALTMVIPGAMAGLIAASRRSVEPHHLVVAVPSYAGLRWCAIAAAGPAVLLPAVLALFSSLPQFKRMG